jgi:hypothetical protein
VCFRLHIRPAKLKELLPAGHGNHGYDILRWCSVLTRRLGLRRQNTHVLMPPETPEAQECGARWTSTEIERDDEGLGVCYEHPASRNAMLPFSLGNDFSESACSASEFLVNSRAQETHTRARISVRVCVCGWPLLLLPVVQGALRTATIVALGAMAEVFSDEFNLKIGGE